MAINLMVVGLICLRTQTGRLYKRKTVDWLEMTCYINLGLFSAIKLYLLKADNSTTNSVIEYISVLITLVLIVAVMLAHIWTEVCSKWFKRTSQGRQGGDDQNNLTPYPPKIDTNPVQPTYSVVEGPRPPAQGQELKDLVGEVSSQGCSKDGRDVFLPSSESLTTPLI